MSATNQKVVQLPRAMHRAAIVSKSFDAEKRTVDVVWTTGARGPRFDWDIGRYYEELSLDPAHVDLARMNVGASVLNSHKSRELADVIGAVVPGSAVVDGKEGRATIQFSEREEVAGFVKDVQAGVIRHISVGYNVSRYQLVDKVEEGENLIPVYRAVDWQPAELSFVPIPFDAGAQARNSDPSESNNCVFVQRGAAAHEGEAMKPEEIEAQRKADAEAAEKRATEAANAAALAATNAERQRAADIRTAVAVLPEAERAAFEKEHIDGGSDVATVRAKVIEKLATSQTEVRSAGRVELGEDQRDKWLRGAGDSIIQRAGLSDTMKKAGHKVEPGEFRGLSLVDLARESLERQGVSTRGWDKMRIVGEAFTYRGGYHTTSDFDVLLENTMHKLLLAGFNVTPDTWRSFCKVGSVSDFRAHNRYLMGSFSTLDAVAEHQEYKNKEIPDAEKQSITAATKGNIIALSRQAIVNDDMDAFSRLPTMFGRAAKLSIEVDVFAALALNSGLGPTLSDGNPIFHARTNRNNISTAAALSAAAIDADRVTLASMKDFSGNEFIDLRPSVLLVPLSLGSTARTINDAQYDPDTLANKSQLKPNTVRGLFETVTDTPRLSGTRRYLFADPNVAPVLEVAFLDGQQEPVMEVKDGWRVDGVEWKVRMDYAVGGVGYYGAITNAGA